VAQARSPLPSRLATKRTHVAAATSSLHPEPPVLGGRTSESPLRHERSPTAP
jgi:hypothetical protein